MDLTTSYLGLTLDHPFIVGASPLVDDLDTVLRLEDAGAAALVMHSLFEEQITREQWGTVMDMDIHADSSAEALSYFPVPQEFKLGPENYLDQIRRIKSAVNIPLIASLNGTTGLGWLTYARLMEQAGADALELNMFTLATCPTESGAEVEERMANIVATVKQGVGIPVAVKLSPFFSSLPHFAKALERAGADGLVLFNRFLQPDINVETLEADATLQLSDSSELLLRLRWLAILHGHLQGSLAVSGGVHTALDAIKALMAGATSVQMVSAVLQNGPARIRTVREGLVAWMEEHEYESLDQLRGSMSLLRCPSPQAFTRANYMRILQGWRV